MRLEVPDPARIIFSKPATTPTTATTVKACGKEGKQTRIACSVCRPLQRNFSALWHWHLSLFVTQSRYAHERESLHFHRPTQLGSALHSYPIPMEGTNQPPPPASNSWIGGNLPRQMQQLGEAPAGRMTLLRFRLGAVRSAFARWRANRVLSPE